MSKGGQKSLIERLMMANPGGKRMSDVSDEDWADMRQKQRKLWIINDNQWHNLQSVSGISDPNREHVEIALGIYRNTAAERLWSPVLTSADTRDQLQRLAKDG